MSISENPSEIKLIHLIKNNYTKWIKEWTRELGFDHCGIAKAVRLELAAREEQTG